MTSVNYPTTYSYVYPNLVATAGPTYTYSYDSASRPIGLTDQNNYAAVSNVVYGGSTCAQANQLASISYFGVTESRCYNTLGQLTSINNTTYTYPSGTNNGKISSQYDAISGETVTYAYDSLNRLLSASGSGWSEAYGFDGFGNLVSKKPTGGAPQLSIGVNPANNQVVGHTYDNNGNDSYGGVSYDAENRINFAPGVQYAYDSQNKRIWKGSFSSGNLTAQEVYFYGVDGQKLGTYSLILNYGTGQPLYLADPNTNVSVYFAGKRVLNNGAVFVQDRLGSNTQGKYYPYGEDRGTPAPNDQVKFATYTRDSVSGLDYADQRYYSNQFGRFMTPDPYRARGGGSGQTADPLSWNKYSYVNGDPIQRYDPWGTCTTEPGAEESDPCPGPEPDSPPSENDEQDPGLRTAGNGGDPYASTLASGIADALMRLAKTNCANLFAGGAAAMGAMGVKDPQALLNFYLAQGLIQHSTNWFNWGSGAWQTFASLDPKNFSQTNVGGVTTPGAFFVNADGTRVSAWGIYLNTDSFAFTGYVWSDGAAKQVGDVVPNQFGGMSMADITAAAIIHELLHAVSAIPSDSGDPAQSARNSALVKKNCF